MTPFPNSAVDPSFVAMLAREVADHLDVEILSVQSEEIRALRAQLEQRTAERDEARAERDRLRGPLRGALAIELQSEVHGAAVVQLHRPRRLELVEPTGGAA